MPKSRLYIILAGIGVVTLLIILSFTAGNSEEDSNNSASFVKDTRTNPQGDSGTVPSSAPAPGFMPKKEFVESRLEETADYVITFYPTANNYHIIITAKPYAANKQKAEQRFSQLMASVDQDPCTVNVVVTAPRYVTEDFAGKQLPLSFCN